MQHRRCCWPICSTCEPYRPYRLEPLATLRHIRRLYIEIRDVDAFLRYAEAIDQHTQQQLTEMSISLRGVAVSMQLADSKS